MKKHILPIMLMTLLFGSAHAAGLTDTILKGMQGNNPSSTENSQSPSTDSKLYGGRDLSHTFVARL